MLPVLKATCSKCRLLVEEGELGEIDGGVLCLDCRREHEDLAEERAQDEAMAYAASHCALVAEIELYRTADHYQPSPDDYAAGNRDAHTENSVLASNRHNCTNYETLIADLARDSGRDRAYYSAIRARCEELVAEATRRAEEGA